MKQRLLLLLLISIIIPGAVHAQKYFTKFEDFEQAARDTTRKNFLVKKSGEIISGQSITFTPHKKYKMFDYKDEWVAIDGKQIPRTDVVAYQTDKFYAARLQEQPTVSTTDFVNRIVAGKIELFYYEHSATGSGDNNNYHAYAFRKGNNALQVLTKEEFTKALADNPQASATFANLFPGKEIARYFSEKGNLKNLMTVVQEYNK